MNAPWIAMATDAPVRKDVVVGSLGAAAALGGLILVFLGVVIAGYQSYSGGTPARLLTPYRRATAAILGVFALSLSSAALSLLWLTSKGGGGLLYAAVLVTFFAQLLAVFVVAVGTTYLVVLK
jgi:hypothetical protein